MLRKEEGRSGGRSCSAGLQITELKAGAADTQEALYRSLYRRLAGTARVRRRAYRGGGSSLRSFSAAPRSAGRHLSSSSRREPLDACVLTFIAATTVPTTFRTGTAIERSPISSSCSLSAKPSFRTLARISSRRLREVTVCLVCWMKSTFD